MNPDYALTLIRRSRLIMPVNQRKFVEKAHARNADAVVLDLEDSVPDTEKIAARAMVKEGIALAGRGGSDVIVRVNHTPELLAGDLESAIWPGLAAVYLPKCESPEEILAVEKDIARLEAARGIAPGHITINAVIETPRGYLNAEKIAAASRRIDSITLGNEDFCAAIDLTNDAETQGGMLALRMHLLVVARAYGKIPLGLVGSMTAFSGSEGFATLARLSAKHGFLGSSCIHPGNVEILNAAFSPSPQSVDRARQLVAALDEAFAQGKAAIALDGVMVDIAHYKKAQAILRRSEAIAALEARKQAARQAAQ